MLINILHLFTLIVFIYISVSVLYFAVIAVAGRFLPGKKFSSHPNKKKIAVIIPSYREDNIICHTAEMALLHDYNKDRFEVIVVADQLLPATVKRLKSIVRVIEADFEQSMKARSLNAALNQLAPERFDIAVILDADNIMESGCLEKINHAFHMGCKAVQCRRTAKNKDTAIAVLDAISEEININLFRRGPAVIGLSAAPIGSGMAFDFELIRQIFNVNHILNNAGEDREIDMQLMKRNIKMEFIDDAYVYDEKVSTSQVFEKQRTRWLEAQLNHFRRFFHADMKDAPVTLVYLNKFFQTLLLPRLLFLVFFFLLTIVVVIQLVTGTDILFPPPSWWLAAMLTYGLTLFISVPGHFYNIKTFRAIVHIPLLMVSMMKAVFKMKKNRTEFLHTPKNVIIK
jgi:cellulose synthase/poly-beta-1,6-N-acetylglucosamine synthase-like glycosyltransferase